MGPLTPGEREVAAEAILALSLVVRDQTGDPDRRRARMDWHAAHVLAACGGDALAALSIAAALVDPDAPVKNWQVADPHFDSPAIAEGISQ